MVVAGWEVAAAAVAEPVAEVMAEVELEEETTEVAVWEVAKGCRRVMQVEIAAARQLLATQRRVVSMSLCSGAGQRYHRQAAQ